MLRVFEFCPSIPIFYGLNFKYMIIKLVSIFIMVNLLIILAAMPENHNM